MSSKTTATRNTFDVDDDDEDEDEDDEFNHFEESQNEENAGLTLQKILFDDSDDTFVPNAKEEEAHENVFNKDQIDDEIVPEKEEANVNIFTQDQINDAYNLFF